MVINKITVIPFKKSPMGNIVYICKPYFTEDDVYFLPNTASEGGTNSTQLEANNLLEEFGLKMDISKHTSIDLGILIYNKMAFKGYAILVEDNHDEEKVPLYIEDDQFVRIKAAIDKCASPFKDFLQRFANWTVI
jgi:hypothetical protein